MRWSLSVAPCEVTSPAGRRHAVARAAVLAAAGLAALVAPRPAVAQEPIRFETADGVTLYGELYRAAHADAPVILLFHQGAGSSEEYTNIAPRLVGAGYHAIAVDQRRGGDLFGRDNRTVRGRPEGPEPTYCDVYPDLEAALGQVDALGLTGPVVAWGSSYSATLIFRLALEHPDRIAAVLAFSPAAGEPMGECQPEPWAERVRQPILVGRPDRELQVDWISEQFEWFRGRGATMLVARDARHASSMLNPERSEGDTEPAWQAVLAFLRGHVPANGGS